MADAAHNKGEIPARIEIPGDVRQLPGIGMLASGIENSETPPPLDLGWEGNHVLAALDAAEYTMPTDNPMFSTLADLSVFHDPSLSEHSGPNREPEAPAHITADANLDAGHMTDTEEREAVATTENKPRRNTRTQRNAPRVRKSGGSMTNENMSRLSLELAYHTLVAASFFVRDRPTNSYRIKMRDGLILDDGTHHRKGECLSEETATTFVTAVIDRQSTSEREATMNEVAARAAKTSSPSPPGPDPIIVAWMSRCRGTLTTRMATTTVRRRTRRIRLLANLDPL